MFFIFLKNQPEKSLRPLATDAQWRHSNSTRTKDSGGSGSHWLITHGVMTHLRMCESTDIYRQLLEFASAFSSILLAWVEVDLVSRSFRRRCRFGGAFTCSSATSKSPQMCRNAAGWIGWTLNVRNIWISECCNISHMQVLAQTFSLRWLQRRPTCSAEKPQ